MKVVINKKGGHGFKLSGTAIKRLVELLEGEKNSGFENAFYKERNNKYLVQVVEELGKEANGEDSFLKVVEIPDGVDFEIAQYNGYEWIVEKHRKWG